MHETDIGRLGELLDEAAITCGSGVPLTPAQKKAYLAALRGVRIETVEAAIRAHTVDPVRGRFMPKPADIVAQLQMAAEADGRPAVDEAWSTALLARDDERTVVWTRETMDAWHIAKSVIQAGDQVGARLAFREAYNRLVAEARAARVGIDWVVSEGFDRQLRDAAVTQAVENGLLPRSELARIAEEGEQMLLLALDGRREVPAAARDSLERVRALILAKQDAPGRDAAERERTRNLQAATQAKVRNLIEGSDE